MQELIKYVHIGKYYTAALVAWFFFLVPATMLTLHYSGVYALPEVLAEASWHPSHLAVILVVGLALLAVLPNARQSMQTKVAKQELHLTTDDIRKILQHLFGEKMSEAGNNIIKLNDAALIAEALLKDPQLKKLRNRAITTSAQLVTAVEQLQKFLDPKNIQRQQHHLEMVQDMQTELEVLTSESLQVIEDHIVINKEQLERFAIILQRIINNINAANKRLPEGTDVAAE